MPFVQVNVQIYIYILEWSCPYLPWLSLRNKWNYSVPIFPVLFCYNDNGQWPLCKRMGLSQLRPIFFSHASSERFPRSSPVGLFALWRFPVTRTTFKWEQTDTVTHVSGWSVLIMHWPLYSIAFKQLSQFNFHGHSSRASKQIICVSFYRKPQK